MEICPICGQPMRGHDRCDLCKILMGAGHFAGAHYIHDNHQLCKDCYHYCKDNELTFDQARALQRKDGESELES